MQCKVVYCQTRMSGIYSSTLGKWSIRIMTYSEMVKKVQDYSGFSEQESDESLKLIVETLSSRLQEGERQNFASQLPSELQDLALAPNDTDKLNADEMFRQLSEVQETGENRVKQQMTAVWQTLKDALTPGQMDHLKAQLPDKLTAQLG